MIVRLLRWVNGKLAKRVVRQAVHARARRDLSELDQYELLVLEKALEKGTTIGEQRALHPAPPHEFSPDKDLRCSVCRLEMHD